ncbi:MAG: SDR family oxidoreductase [Proteobacteria bacterium]|nr:SDR family oxidoreductase [Pseudomonadota bacterium]MBS0572053.1 SDR family oxidoreductase [Pseudomonadota bacterium]
MTRTLFVLGMGYTAQALARRLLPGGWQVIGTTRSPDKAARLAAAGIEPLIWPGTALAPALRRATHLLASIGAGADGDPVLACHRDGIAQAAAHLRWAGYLSTTGVYGDHRGAWVDEDTPLTPSTERGRWRKLAEDQWRAVPDLPLHVFRLAGIYGPGRGPFAKVRDGTARLIVKDGQYMSRIHVDDLAAVLAVSMAAPAPGRAYNVCDDEPSPPEDVLRHAARLLGLPDPPAVRFEEARMSDLARSFYSESKRVRNDRIRRELGVRLAFPTYREGLAALLSSDEA